MENQLTHKEAFQIVQKINEELGKRNKAAIIAVVDAHGELLAFLRHKDAKLSSINIALNKAYTAARAQKNTSEIGRAVNDPEKGYDISFYGDPRFTGFGGGVPVRIKDKILGGVAVSGLSSEEDEELALLGIGKVLQQ